MGKAFSSPWVLRIFPHSYNLNIFNESFNFSNYIPCINSKKTMKWPWHSKALFIDAQCNEEALQSTIQQIEIDSNKTRDDISIIATAKTNIRLIYDCHHNSYIRETFFTHYISLVKQKVILTNVLADLMIKKNVLEGEVERCRKRGITVDIHTLWSESWINIVGTIKFQN